MPLTILIVGSGIASLTLAAFLRPAGHTIHIFERSPTLPTTGAAIHLAPNSTCLLKRLPFDFSAAGANDCKGLAQYHGDGSLKHKLDVSGFMKAYKDPWLLSHRADLAEELRRVALDPARDEPVPVLHLGKKVTAVDAEKATVTLEDGDVVTGDVVIGGDGVGSVCRSAVDPVVKPYPWGKSCYRFLVPRTDLANDAEIDLLDPPGWFGEVSEADRRFVFYPCRKNTMMNFAAFVPNDEVDVSGKGWNEHGDKHQMLKAFDKFSPGARKLISHAGDDIRVWMLYDMENLSTWCNGRVVLIGDAAHPFLPFLGQGGAMAIEDAACLARLLPGDVSIAEVISRLKLYENIRQDRVVRILEGTRWNGMDEDKRATGENLGEMFKFCFDHDEWENTGRMLQMWEGETSARPMLA